MPKPHFASITVEEGNYLKWYDYYQKHKTDFFKRGITSFSSFITAILNGYIPTPFGEKK